MRIDDIFIDRFGQHSRLALQGFSDQLNVIYGPNGSGKKTVAQFIRWVLFGRVDATTFHGRQDAANSTAGTLRILQGDRQHELTRHDDGSRYGRLSLDGQLQPEQTVQSVTLVGSLHARDFDLIFAPDFHAEPDLAGLLHVARHRGLELNAGRQSTHRIQEIRLRIDQHRRDLERFSWSGKDLQSLLDFRASLERRMAASEDDTRRRRSSVDREYDALNQEVTQLEATIHQLREQWHTRDQDVLTRRTELEEAWRTADDARREFVRWRRQELSELEGHVEQARTMLAELQRRANRLDDELRDRELAATLSAADQESTLCHVQTLAKQLDDLRSSAPSVATAPLYRPVYGRADTVTASPAALEGLRSEVHRLCRVLQRDQETNKLRSREQELSQLRKCEEEISGWLQKMIVQRDRFARELEDAERFGVSLVWEDVPAGMGRDGERLWETSVSSRKLRAVLHACDGFQPIDPTADEVLRQLVASRDLMQRDLDAAERQLRQHLDRRRELELTLHRFEDHEVARLRREIADLDAQIRVAEERTRIQREIELLEHELARVGQERVSSGVLRHAADLLRDFSGGDLVDLRVADDAPLDLSGVHVQAAAGALIPYRELSRGIRDQVYLSLCMAMASALRHQGIELPLLLNDIFLNLDSEREATMATTLSAFARQGHQLLLFTRHRHVVERFQPFQARVMELGLTQPVAQPVPAAPQVSEVRFRAYPNPPASTSQRFAERGIVSYRRLQHGDVSEYRSLSQSAAGQMASGTAYTDYVSSRPNSSREAVLRGETTLVNSGTVDFDTARQLQQINIYTVDELLRSSPEYIERESQRRGLRTPSSHLRLREELSLRCNIPGLDHRQARLLAGAGINNLHRLAEQTVASLRERLQRASDAVGATPADFMSAHDNQRFADWIQHARRVAWPVSHSAVPAVRDYAWERHENYQPAYAVTGTFVPGWEGTQTQSSFGQNSTHTSYLGDKHAGNGPLRAEHAPNTVREYEDQVDVSPSDYRREEFVGGDSPSGKGASTGVVARQRKEGRAKSITRKAESRLRGKSESAKRQVVPSDDAVTRSTPLRHYLSRQDSLVDAPSIGPRTASKFREIGITNVSSFLEAEPSELADQLGDNRITAKTIGEWQSQTALACRVPELRGHDAQILVGCGITEPKVLADMSPEDLWNRVRPFSRSPEGKRIIRGGKAPDLAEVADWIRWAKEARSLEDA